MTMTLFNNPDFDQHEKVICHYDAQSGLKAIVAIHNTRLGPALGGCRIYPYATDADAITDVLRLARGMTGKSALANLALGGGKSVIIADPRKDKTPELLLAMGRFVESLAGDYILGQDSGTTVNDLTTIAQETSHLVGNQTLTQNNQPHCTADPSPYTALGVFASIQAAVAHRFGSNALDGIKVAIQGVGNVGMGLARHLHEAGAELLVSDVNEEQLKVAEQTLNARIVNSDDIHRQAVDIFAPCALGGSINAHSIEELQASIIVGGANNQLLEDTCGQALQAKNILYAPDYVVNAGGVIFLEYLRTKRSPKDARQHILSISDTLMEIFTCAEQTKMPTNAVADQLAQERFQGKTNHL